MPSYTFSFNSAFIRRVIPQTPHDFKWQPVERVSNQTVLLPQSRDSCHRVSATNCPPRSTHLSLLLRENSTVHLVSRKRTGDLRLLCRLPMLLSSRNGSDRTVAPPPLWMHKHTYLRSHDFVYSPHLWYESRLANSLKPDTLWNYSKYTSIYQSYIGVTGGNVT